MNKFSAFSLKMAAAGASLLLCAACTLQTNEYNEGINITPAPAHIEVVQGQYFTLFSPVVIVADGDQECGVAEFYAKKISASTGYKVEVAEESREGSIYLEIDEDSDIPEEGYTLSVDKEGIEIEASTRNGLFYGMATLIQLLPAEIESDIKVKGVNWKVPFVEIEDSPRFGYRGIHLDPCRHFIPVEQVKKHLDAMALYKFNVMHFHLTEDQGWRIEIKKYPELTEKGSVRVEGEGTLHEGFYTQEELRDLVQYASERGITIIPEIEFPGHALAAITAYPWLSCNGKETTPRVIWGVEDVIMCAGKESTFEFAENVIKEVVDIFPSEYIHIGGDEAPKGEWEKCPLCQKRIREEGLTRKVKGHTPEMRLQSYFIGRIEKIVAKYGRKIIGWDEILEGGLPASATVMSWRGLFGGIAAAMEGHDAIMTPSSEGLYLNFYQGDSKVEPVSIGGYYPMERLYSYDPVPDTVSKLGLESHILGVQGNCWSEYMYSDANTEYTIYPRVVAVAEIGWSSMEKRDFKDFCRRLDNQCMRLGKHHINYHLPVPEQPYGSCDRVAFTDSVTLTFTTTRPMKMVYTLNGSEPDPSSKEYTAPILLKKSATLKICSILPFGKKSAVRTIEVVKEPFAPAVEVADPKQGLAMSVAKGMFLNRESLYEEPRQWEESTIADLRELREQAPSDNVMRDVPQCAAIAKGYIMIPEDGVYYFSTDLNDFSIDGKRIIDNDNLVKRFSRNDCSVALKKGLHPIEATFLGHIIGGWPSNWSSSEVLMRRADQEKFAPVTSQMLWH